MQALAPFQVGLQHFGLVVASHFISSARLHASQDRHQALFNAIPLGDFLRLLLFGDAAAAKIDKGTPQRRGQLFGALTDLGGQSGGKLL